MPTEILRPNAAGIETNISTQVPTSGEHWDKVDEADADDSSTFIHTVATTYERDLYNLPASSVGQGTINSIEIYFCVRSFGLSYSAYIMPSLESGGTIISGAGVDHRGASWAVYSQQWNANPVTEEPWGWADIDALQIGIRLRGSDSKAAYCTQIYIEIDYRVPVTHEGSATLSGVGTLAGIPHAISAGQSTLSGIGSLSAIGLTLGKIYGSATLSGIGNLGVSSVLNMRATASLAGAGSMAAAGMRIRTGSVILVGTGLLVIRGRITFLIEPDSLGFSDTEADGIMVAPYYLGNTIPLIFTVSEGGVALSPSSVTIRIVKPDKTVDETSEAIITNDEVECLIPASITDEAGTYQVYFKMNLPNYLIRTHKMTFEVLNNR